MLVFRCIDFKAESYAQRELLRGGFQSNSPHGDGNVFDPSVWAVQLSFNQIPLTGTETPHSSSQNHSCDDFQSNSPHGDGNLSTSNFRLDTVSFNQIPLTGTETDFPLGLSPISLYFQSNSPHGDGNLVSDALAAVPVVPDFQSNSPHGDGNNAEV